MTEKLINSITTSNIENFLYNDLEYAIINDYEELKFIKNTCNKREF